ncbi:unnamed protein product, partial [marine sediment metagenome]
DLAVGDVMWISMVMNYNSTEAEPLPQARY